MKNGGLLRRHRSTTDNESLPLELWKDDGDLNGFNFSQVFHDSSNYETADQRSSNVDRRAEYLLDLFFQPDSCLMSSILQIWNFDLERIRSLDQHQILEDVNDALLNEWVSLSLRFKKKKFQIMFLSKSVEVAMDRFSLPNFSYLMCGVTPIIKLFTLVHPT